MDIRVLFLILEVRIGTDIGMDGHGDDKKLEYKWIEPVFVCGSYSSDKDSDVVIHKVE